MSATLRQPLDTIAAALAAQHLRAVKVQDRLDSLDGRTGVVASEELRGDPTAALAVARELVADLFRVASDERLGPVLEASTAAPAPTRALAARLGLTRLVLVRRVGELAGAGLAERDPETDMVRATPLGASVVALLAEMTSTTAAALAEADR